MNKKQEYLVVGSTQNMSKRKDVSNIKVGDMSVERSASVRIIGAIIFDNSMMDRTVDHLTSMSATYSKLGVISQNQTLKN